MQYRQTDITGASYFFTANLAERHKCLLVEVLGIAIAQANLRATTLRA